MVAQPADREPEPRQVRERRLGVRRPDRAPRSRSRLAGPCTARLCIWSVECLTHTRSRPGVRGLLAQPRPGVLVAAHEPEVVVPEPEHRAVVDHAAGLVAHRGVDDLPVREPPDVARDAVLHQRLGVRAQHLELAQRRQVHHGGPLPAGPVLVLRSVGVEAGRQPVAAVLGELPGQRRGPRVERRLFRQRRRLLRGDAVRDGHGELPFGVVDPDVHVGRAPSRSTGRCRPGTRTRRTPGRWTRGTARSRRDGTTARRTRAGCGRRTRCCRRGSARASRCASRRRTGRARR